MSAHQLLCMPGSATAGSCPPVVVPAGPNCQAYLAYFSWLSRPTLGVHPCYAYH